MRDATKISDYFKGDKTLFIIPIYQRNYAWEEKHCERLFKDLERINRDGVKSHFFGSIVSTKASETEDDLLIIDGQQRITTLSLIVLAAMNAVKNGDIEGLSEEDMDSYCKLYLKASLRKVERKTKLVPIDNDIKAYDALFENNIETFVPAEKSGVTRNYLLFYRFIKESKMTFEEIVEAIEKLVVIDIRLDSSDNPQLIFESLNSCGKDLDESDKVRNYLLMSLDAETQKLYYKNYWSKIEHFTDMQPSMFIRDYLTMRLKSISSLEDLYFDFKKYMEESKIDRAAILADMTKYADFYMQVRKGESKLVNDDEKKANKRKNEKIAIDRKLKQLASLETLVMMPYFMAFWDYAEREKLSFEEKYQVLDVVENYWARRIICNYPANAMQKLFALLHYDILRYIENDKTADPQSKPSYSEILKYILLKKQGVSLFPSNDLVKEWFPKRGVYKIPNGYKLFLLERLENCSSKEADYSLIQNMKDGRFSIEHIMPQSLNNQWKKDLGEDFENIHNAHLHTLANLTITGYNTPYGNRPFEEKKNGFKDKKGNDIKGFKDSKFHLSDYLKTCSRWTKDEILARNEILYNEFVQLWPMITTSYVPSTNEYEIVSFDDDEIEMTGRTIKSFSYKGQKMEVDSWKAMLVELCKKVYEEKSPSMAYLASKEKVLFTQNKADRAQIADGIFIRVSYTTQGKIQNIQYIFKELEIPAALLEFEIEPLNNDDVLEDE